MIFQKKRCVAMLLAGGQGSRLKVLTENTAKPAVPFGGKYRIIDFPLSNCVNSGIDTVGILTQYQPLELNEYIGNGQPWGLNKSHGRAQILPPYARSKKSEWYKGTANAIYQNIPFLARYEPENVVILSGDHIYRMDYAQLVRFHEANGADCTIAVRTVPLAEASRFGIMNTNEDGTIYEFEEKPKKPKSTNASMGIYCFKWDVLRKYLMQDEEDPKSSNDFGKNVIPAMLADGCKMYAWRFDGYWKDVGTIESLWEANMDLLGTEPAFSLRGKDKIFSRNFAMPASFIDAKAKIRDSFIAEGCDIGGTVSHCVVSTGCAIEAGAIVEDSVIMPDTTIKAGAIVRNAIIGENSCISSGAVVGGLAGETQRISVVGHRTTVPENHLVPAGEIY